MLVVLADDFSGAAEIGGIAYRYGLQAEVQLDFNSHTNADVIILDTDTRGVDEQQAAAIINMIARKLKASNFPMPSFKKVDSVLRGHIVAEINALQQAFNFDKILLLPANPGRGRKIVSGNYLVNDITLDKTVFATDPHFPGNTSSITEIISARPSNLPHVHITVGSRLPSKKLITADVASKEDLKNYIKQTTPDDLCCGAAECFEACLEHKEFMPKADVFPSHLKWPPYTLIVSGSTVREQFQEDLIADGNLLKLGLPGQWEKDKFVLKEEDEQAWHKNVLDSLRRQHLVFVSIDHEIKQLAGTSNFFSDYFVRLVQYISGKLRRHNIHYCITGGATASGIIRNIGCTDLKVKKEIAPGIVTLVNENTGELFTVKPGSYTWPSSFIKSLIKN